MGVWIYHDENGYTTSNSSTDESDVIKSGSDIVCFRACSAATWISDNLMGRSTGREVSDIAGPDSVLAMKLEADLLGESFELASKPELPRQKYTKAYK